MPDTPPAGEKAIFLAALDLSDIAERERYIDEACAGDASLRERVMALLSARVEEEKFPAASVEDITSLTAPDGDTGAPPSPGDAIGYFGEYLLLAEIARGGSGVVFRAKQVSLNRTVALKMLRNAPVSQDEELARRFLAEAEAAATLDHPNIVPIYEVGKHHGQDYYSMKLVEGGTLNSRMAEFQADPRRAAEVMVKVCRAVHHAHQQAILHRDLKPGNILVDTAGEPHVADFGLARHLGSDLDLTVTGMVLGTPHYMSPEQARGESRRLTVGTDVYSLGAVLYELMAGRRAFAGDSAAALLSQVADTVPPALRTVRPERDRDMETMIMRCLEKSPVDRYGSAAALADDLERWLRGEPILARPPGMAERVWKWARRKPALAAVAALAALMAIGLVAALAVSRHLVGQALERSEQSLALARESLDRAEGRVTYMTTVLPDMLEPVGRLDLLHGPFQNVEEYYSTLPSGAQDAAALSRHAAFLYRWSSVLWKVGHRRERLERLEEAAPLVRAALIRPGAGQQEWMTAATVLRALSDAREIFNDTQGAEQVTKEAQAAVTEGLGKFPKERHFVLEQARINLQAIRRARARGDSKAALALAQTDAPVWRTLFDESLTGQTGTGREARAAASEFYAEWVKSAREADQEDLAVLKEYEQRTAAAMQALPEDAVVRKEYSTAMSYVGNYHTGTGDRERAAEYYRLYLEEARKAVQLDPGSLALKAELHVAEGLFAQVLDWKGDAAGAIQMLDKSLQGLDAIQARDGALDSYIDGVRVNTLLQLATRLAAQQKNPEACDRVEQAMAARWRRTLARSSEWAEHRELDSLLVLSENWLEEWGGAQRILPAFLHYHGEMQRVTPIPGTEALWSWTRGALLRRMGRDRLFSATKPEEREQAWLWMEESHKLRLAGISQPGAQPDMLRQTHFGIITWLDHSPPELHSRMLVPAQELIAAIPAALRLGPDAVWRQDWGDCLLRAAALMPAESAPAFCRTAEQALFGMPCGRDWTAEETAVRDKLRSKFSTP